MGPGASELGSESLSSLSGLGSLEGLSALRPVLARAPPPGSASPLSHLATMAVRPLMFSADTVAVGMRVYGSAWSTHRLLGSAPSTASRWRRQQPCDGGGNHSSERGLRRPWSHSDRIVGGPVPAVGESLASLGLWSGPSGLSSGHRRAGLGAWGLAGPLPARTHPLWSGNQHPLQVPEVRGPRRSPQTPSGLFCR